MKVYTEVKSMYKTINLDNCKGFYNPETSESKRDLNNLDRNIVARKSTVIRISCTGDILTFFKQMRVLINISLISCHVKEK
jgi:hypothetical protein